ncbi:hypothetical protein M758_11G078800 [Ceratodon purpureus]|nr:hypothetical protein M758_11G078800 [Ceratodon purpureus]
MDQVQDVGATSGQFARICVFCGSSSGKKAIYTQVAEELGTELVRRGINLVYGGGSIGLMGTVAQAAHAAGGHVVGVIPKALMPKEICGNTIGDLVAVDDMHQRKAEMARRADAFIALPGGFGTFEEVLEIITWAQLGIHRKPVGLLNVDGYYDAILTLFNKALDEGFLNLASHNIVVSAPTASELLDKLKKYEPTVDKSVPELTWDSIGSEPACNSPNVTDTTPTKSASAAIPDMAFHLNDHMSRRRSSTVGAFNTDLTRHIGTDTIRGRLHTSPTIYRGAGCFGTLNLLPQVFPTTPSARSGRFSVHTHTRSINNGSKLESWSKSIGRNAVDTAVRVVAPLII